MRKSFLVLIILGLLFSALSPVLAQTELYKVVIKNVESESYSDGSYIYVEGAIYKVTRIYEFNDDGSQVDTEFDMGEITVGPMGAIFETSVKGGYKFEQVIRAPGYLLVNESFVIEFPQMENGVIAEDQEVEILQKAIRVIGTVSLLKLDDKDQALSGAVFELWQTVAPGQDVTLPRKIGDKYTSDAQGEIIVENLPEGEYEFREIEAPNGFKLSDQVLKFKIEPNGETPVLIELSFINVADLKPIETPTITPTPGPTKTPMPPTVTPQPTKPPIKPPDAGTSTEYILLGIGGALTLAFIVLLIVEKKKVKKKD